MHKRTIFFGLLAVFAMSPHGASGQVISRLRTEQTSLEFRAQTAGPQLVRLGNWTNEIPEKLI
ncbi:MAG: hypothetical protein ACRD5Z_24535, partial [Bryobacteraceae bacterium]